MARGLGSSRRASNRQRETREGPELACVQTPFLRGVAHVGEVKGEETRPASEVPPVRRTDAGKKTGLLARVSDRHVVRGRQSSRIPALTASRHQ